MIIILQFSKTESRNIWLDIGPWSLGQMTPAARCSCSSPSLYNPNVSSWKPILFPVCTRADTHLLCVHLQYNLGKMRFLCRMLSFHPGKVREGYFCFPYMRSHTHASSDFLWFGRFCIYLWNRHACAALTFYTGWFLHWYPPISVPKRKPAKQPITAFLSISIYRNSTSDWLVGSFLFGTEIGEHQLKQARKLGRCDSYLQNLKTLLTHWLTQSPG